MYVFAFLFPSTGTPDGAICKISPEFKGIVPPQIQGAVKHQKAANCFPYTVCLKLVIQSCVLFGSSFSDCLLT